MNAAPPGSYLALYDGVHTDDAKAQAEETYADTGAVAYRNRPPDEVIRFFDDYELVEPGVVSISQWRPDPTVIGTVTPVGCHGGVARKS